MNRYKQEQLDGPCRTIGVKSAGTTICRNSLVTIYNFDLENVGEGHSVRLSHTHTHTNTQTHRHTDTQTHRNTHTHTHRNTQKHT